MADVNGDGKPDIVVANCNSDTVSVLLGNGNGTFQPRPTFATGASPVAWRSPTSTATASPTSSSPTDGATRERAAGQRQRHVPDPATFATGATPYSVAVADLNGDGRPDLVTANYDSNTVSVLLGNGNGNFTGQVYTIDHTDPLRRLDQPHDPADRAHECHVRRLHRHLQRARHRRRPHRLCLATTGTAGATLTARLHPSAASVYTVTVSGITGNGTLGLNLVDNGTIRDLAGNPLSPTSAAASFAAPGHLRHGLATDLGRGRRTSTATASRPGRRQLQQRHRERAAGQRQRHVPDPRPPTPRASNPASVAVADVNGDGKPDLVVANHDERHVSVLLGNGNGTFRTPDTFATGSNPARSRWRMSTATASPTWSSPTRAATP